MEVEKKRFKEIWVSEDGKKWIFYLHCISFLVVETIKDLEAKGYVVRAVSPNDKRFEELRKIQNVIPNNIE